MERINMQFVNEEYANLVFENQQLLNSKVGTKEQISEMENNLFKFEMALSSEEIIHSTRYAFVKQ